MLKAQWEKTKSYSAAVVIPAANEITKFTKGLHYKANFLSSKMDLASGGCSKHGGFHRLYGGHDISNIAYLRRYGSRYVIELAKDFITPNGLPYPKLQSAVKKGFIRASTAQKWGTWNIGKFASTTVGVVETAFTIRKFARNRDEFNKEWKSTTLKGGAKIFVGLQSGAIPLAAAGAIDISMVAYVKVDENFCIDLTTGWDLSFGLA